MPPPPPDRDELLPGTLELIVLRVLHFGALHGWAITDRLSQGSHGAIQLNQGSLYPALYRLERQGMISSSWQTTENNRRARYYALTTAGRKALVAEREKWVRQTHAINLILRLEAP